MHRLRCPLAAAALTVGLAAAAFARAPAPPDREIVGLYVGIGEYEDPSVWSFDLHRTNRDVLLPLLAERFGVRWLPPVMDADATRDGIRAGMLELLSDARAARARGSDVTVVFVYTGHGSQLRDQDGDEPDQKDESLVTHRSSIEEGAEDIRDDDIAVFRRAVADAGAEFVMIMEACHSESTFRGPPPLALMRPRRPLGPTEPLFPELTSEEQSPEDGELSKFFDGGGTGRFVCIAAAQDEIQAATTYVDDRQWGCFSLALVSAIETLPPGATYRDLHEAVVREFDVRFPSERQRPTLHPRSAGRDHRDEPALGGAVRSPHARVTVDGDTGVATLDAGSARGYGADATVALFATIDDLESWERGGNGAAPLCRIRIADSSFDRARLDDVTSLPDTAVARIVVPALPPALVRLDAGLDATTAAAIRAAADPTVVRFTDDDAQAAFLLDAPDAGTFAVLPVGAETPLRTVHRSPDHGDTARAVADNLAFVIRTQRFWALLGNRREVDVRVEYAGPGGAVGAALPVSAEGVVTCADGTRVTITITNNAAEARRIGLFQSEAPDGVLGGFELVYESPDLVAPGASATLTGPMRLSAPGLVRERLRLKVVATTLPRITLPAELREPDTARRTRGASGAPDPFARMFGNAQSGTRSAGSPLSWAARNLVIDVLE